MALGLLDGVVILLLAAAPVAAPQPAPAADRALVVVVDGLRWQEVFAGASAELARRGTGGVEAPEALEARFVRADAEAAREALMPFFWRTIAVQGTLLGDASAGSPVQVTNGLNLSYPGYSELLTGAVDPAIRSNDKVANPGVSVLEWLDARPSFAGAVEAVASWETFPFILNVERSRLPVNVSAVPYPRPASAAQRAIAERAAALRSPFRGARLDAVTVEVALETLKTRKPKVLFVSLNDADEWGHQRRYDLYLDAVSKADAFLRSLWEAAQAMPEYAGRTSLVVLADHGRGATSVDWTDHHKGVPADKVFVAVMGPRTPAAGVKAGSPATLSQVAATIAALVGEDLRAARPKVAAPLPVTGARR